MSSFCCYSGDDVVQNRVTGGGGLTPLWGPFPTALSSAAIDVAKSGLISDSHGSAKTRGPL